MTFRSLRSYPFLRVPKDVSPLVWYVASVLTGFWGVQGRVIVLLTILSLLRSRGSFSYLTIIFTIKRKSVNVCYVIVRHTITWFSKSWQFIAIESQLCCCGPTTEHNRLNRSSATAEWEPIGILLIPEEAEAENHSSTNQKKADCWGLCSTFPKNLPSLLVSDGGR